MLLPETPSATLVIAGDTSHYNTLTVELLKELKGTYSNIIIVYGNHDMYLTSEAQRNKYQSSDLKVAQLKGELEEIEGVWFLDGDKIEINGIVFAGLCGWYDLPTKYERDQWRFFMNDSNYIYSGIEYRTPYHHGSVRAEWDTQEFYEQQKVMLEGLNEIDVLVTHVAQVIPSDEVLPEMYRGDYTNIFYYVDNMELVKATGCKCYIYGHTHNEQEWEQQGVKVLCNPYGYPRESIGRKIKTLKVDLRELKATEGEPEVY